MGNFGQYDLVADKHGSNYDPRDNRHSYTRPYGSCDTCILEFCGPVVKGLTELAADVLE